MDLGLADARVVVKDEIRYQGDDGGPAAEAHDVEHEQKQCRRLAAHPVRRDALQRRVLRARSHHGEE